MGRLPWTLLVVGSSLVLSTLLGVILGIESGWRRGSRTDRTMLAGLMSLNGFPDFFLGLVLLIVFGVLLRVAPLSGALTPYSGLSGFALVLDVLKHMALPVAALTLAHLSGLSPEVAYNLGQACWFGLLVLGCFGLGFNLAALAGREKARVRGPLLCGGLTAIVVAVTSNLHATVTWISSRLGSGTANDAGSGWWWWPSSRVVRDTDLAGNPVEVITEFPFFSYLLGDNHPHLLSMPFVIVCVAVALTASRSFLMRAVSWSATCSSRPRSCE